MELGTHFKIVILSIITLLTFSCKKEEDRTCFKSNGQESSLELTGFKLNKLSLSSKIKYVLIQDSTNKVVIQGGENLIKHIELAYDGDSILHISDKNKCKLLRKMNRQLTVEIHLTDLEFLRINTGDSVVSRGVIKSPFIGLTVKDGAASIKLNIDVDEINTFANYGFCDITYTGKAKVCNNNLLSVTAINTLGLQVSHSFYVSSSTSQSIYINVDKAAMTGEIKSNGNVYYKGNPSYVDFHEKAGNGKLIKLE